MKHPNYDLVTQFSSIVNYLYFAQLLMEHDKQMPTSYFVEEVGVSEVTIRRYVSQMRKSGLNFYNRSKGLLLLTRTIDTEKLKELINRFDNTPTSPQKILSTCIIGKI
jgi:DeoR/GlpR family transcriptional regulator of sugar metabolism